MQTTCDAMPSLWCLIVSYVVLSNWLFVESYAKMQYTNMHAITLQWLKRDLQGLTRMNINLQGLTWTYLDYNKNWSDVTYTGAYNGNLVQLAFVLAFSKHNYLDANCEEYNRITAPRIWRYGRLDTSHDSVTALSCSARTDTKTQHRVVVLTQMHRGECKYNGKVHFMKHANHIMQHNTNKIIHPKQLP